MCASFNETAQTPEKWKRPDEVMRLHKLRIKKKALQARMNRTELPSIKIPLMTSVGSVSVTEKRKNPFRLAYVKFNFNI